MTDDDRTALLDLLADEHTQHILQETMIESLSAEQLSNACGISPQSVYRRTEPLTSYGLLEAEMQYDPEGHHHTVFSANPTHLVVDITPDDIEITVSQQEQMVNRFAEFVRQVREQ